MATSQSPDLPKPRRSRARSSATGKFVASPDTAQRDAEAARLRVEGKTYRQIADALGFTSEGTAHEAAARAMRETRRDAGEELKRFELDRLDVLYDAAMGILRREHLAHGAGRVVVDPKTGRPLLDSGPALAAIKTLLDIQARRAKLEGLDSPTRHSVDADALGREILAMLAQAGGTGAAADDDRG